MIMKKLGNTLYLIIIAIHVKDALCSRTHESERSRFYYGNDPSYRSINNVKISSRTKVQILGDDADDSKDNNNRETKILVKLKARTSISQILSNKVDLKMDRPNILSLRIKRDDLHVLENDPNVEYIELNHDARVLEESSMMKMQHNHQGNERKLAEEIDWGMNEVLQDAVFWDELPAPDNSIKICVCDTGYELGHEDLPLEPDVTGFNNPNIDEDWSFDGHGHGSHTAGTVGALGNNNVGYRGVIPNNKDAHFQLIIAKTFDKSGIGDVASILYSIEQCVENGANIISLSLGSTSYDQVSAQYLQEVYDDGVLLVSAAGNLGDDSFTYPASYTSSMSIAAVDDAYNKASFSQYNNQVELSAPGTNINNCWKDNGYMSKSGTSMAAPHVAGVAGLLWMYFPECTNQQIRNVLSASAKMINDDLTTCGTNTGYGLIQAIDAFNMLDNGGCALYANITNAKGGCQQLDTYSLSCTADSDCDDNDPCTVDSCTAQGVCTTTMDCSQCQKDGLVTIDVLTDAYPDETTWDIKTGSTTLASGGPFAEMIPYTTHVCLSADAYTFTIYDAFGDGVCCAEGNGSYNVTLDNTVLRTGGSFGESEETTINITSSLSIITNEPSFSPSNAPSSYPSNDPTIVPSKIPSTTPTSLPSLLPSLDPSVVPTIIPSKSFMPTDVNTTQPPSNYPSTFPSMLPSASFKPSLVSYPSVTPSLAPSLQPSNNPTILPSNIPSTAPTSALTLPDATSGKPSIAPLIVPTITPSISSMPSNANTTQFPSNHPSTFPSMLPFTSSPTISPAENPTKSPNIEPTNEPKTNKPTKKPTKAPSIEPTSKPKKIKATKKPKKKPTNKPSKEPTKPPNAMAKLRKKIKKNEKIVIEEDTKEKKKTFKSLKDIRKHMKKISEKEMSNNNVAKQGKTFNVKEGKDSKKKKSRKKTSKTKKKEKKSKKKKIKKKKNAKSNKSRE